MARAYYSKNKGKVAERVAAYRKAHPEWAALYQKEWQAKNRQKCVEYSRRWRSKNPDLAREQDRVRRNEKQAASSTLYALHLMNQFKQES
jgi:hypothetical protein